MPGLELASFSLAMAADACFRRIAYPDGLSVLVSDSSTELSHMIGVRAVMPRVELEQILAHVSAPEFAWTTGRHTSYPTVDVETASIPWLDELLLPHLRDTLLPTLAEVFRVDAAHLLLRDSFVIKYTAADGADGRPPEEQEKHEANSPRAQPGLKSHFDESCFSFILQLNPLADFTGGGTKFAHASGALSVAPGEAMCFCGFNFHEGVAILSGERYLLTGFVDLRAPPAVMARFRSCQPLLPDAGTGYLVDFASPHLPYNVALLRERYGAHGDALLRAIAHAPCPIPYVDAAPLARKCAAWLLGGECEDEHFYRFLCETIGPSQTHENLRSYGPVE